MIHDPNVIVRNFVDNRGIVFSGTISENVLAQVNNINHKFAYVYIAISETSAATTIRLLSGDGTVSYDNVKNPRYREINSTEWKTIDDIKLNYVTIRRYIVDVSDISSLVVYARGEYGTDPATVDVGISFGDVEPQLDKAYIQNFVDKLGKVFTGAISNRELVRLSNIKHRYAVVDIDVTTASASQKLYFLNANANSYSDKLNPRYRTPESNEWTKVVSSSDGISLSTVGISRYIVDTFSLDVLSVYSNSPSSDDNAASVDVYVNYYDEDNVFIKSIKDYMPVEKKNLVFSGNITSSPFAKFTKILNRYAHVEVNVLTASSTQKIAFLTSNMTYSDTFNPPFREKEDIEWKKTVSGATAISLDSVGKRYFIVDVTNIDSLYLYANNLSDPANVQVCVYFDENSLFENEDTTDHFNELKMVQEQDILPINIKGAKFQRLREMKNVFGEYWVSYSSNYLYIGKNDDVVTINKSFFGHGNIDWAGDMCAPTLLPYYSGSFKETKKMGIVVGFADGTILRCDITNIADANTLSNWSAPNFWEKQGTARKIPIKNSSNVDANHRYDTTLPDSRYTHDVVASDGHIAYQGTPYLRRLTLPAWSKHAVMIAQYDVNGRRCSAWATDDGGVNIVSVWDCVTISLQQSADIDTSAFTAYGSGLQMFKVTRNIPSSVNKEPAAKYTMTEISGFSITKGAKTVITKTAHGLSDCDIVLFTGDAGTEWNQLTTSGSGSDSLGDNAYFVKKIDNDSFYLMEYTGSYDTQLACRHIHSVQEWAEGFIIGTGEEYPQSWFISLGKSYYTETVMNAVWKTYRLNSSENGVQRPCGIISDGAIQPSLIFGADTVKMDLGNYVIDGRTDTPTITSYGIYKIALADIDDISKAVKVCDTFEKILGLYKLGNTIVAKMNDGGLGISFDSGETWEYFSYASWQNYAKNLELNGQYLGRIVLGNGYILCQ